MASNNTDYMVCPQCKTLVKVYTTYGIYPCKTEETADCPVCGYTLTKKNITGDIETSVESMDNTIEPYKSKTV